MFWKGAGVVLYYVDLSGEKNILVGCETKYLSDDMDLFSEQAVSFTLSQIQARDYFTKSAKALTNTLGKLVTYDTPEQLLHSWHVNMRIASHFWGIPKGGKNPGDLNPLDTARREVLEEVGFDISNLEANHFSTDRGYYFYSIEIPYSLAQQIEATLQDRYSKHFAEMHELQFMPEKEVVELMPYFNGLGRMMFAHFFNVPWPWPIPSAFAETGK